MTKPTTVLVGTALLMGACEADWPPVVERRPGVVIHSYEEVPPCTGEVAQQTRDLWSGLLGVDPEVHVVVVDDASPWCPDEAGCAPGRYAVGGHDVLAHETVHAVAHSLGHAPAFLTEGLAELNVCEGAPTEAFVNPSERSALRSWLGLGSFRGLDDEEEHGARAASADLVAFVSARFGWDALAALYERLPRSPSMAVLDEAFTEELGEGLEAVLAAWEAEGPISKYDRCRVVVGEREPLEAGDGGEMRCRRTSIGSALGFGGVLGFSSEQRLRLTLQGIRGASARLLPVEPPGPSSGGTVLDRHAVFIWDTDASELQLDGWTQDSQQTEPGPTYEIQTEPLGDPCAASVMDVTGVEAVSYGDIRTDRAATGPSTPSAVLAFTSETSRTLWVTRREGADAFLCPDSCDVADCQEITDAWLDEPRFEPLAAGETHRILLFANDASTRVGFEMKLLAPE